MPVNVSRHLEFARHGVRPRGSTFPFIAQVLIYAGCRVMIATTFGVFIRHPGRTVAALSYIGSMMGYGMTATRIFRVQVPIFGASALGIMVTCLLCIESQGMVGGAYAILVGACTSVSGSALVLGRSVFWKSKAMTP
jgi:hypothetical protein